MGAHGGDEAQAGARGDEELGAVDRADDAAGLQTAAGQHRRRPDGAPAAAGDRVDEPGTQAERHEEALAQRLAEVAPVEPAQGEPGEQIDAEREQEHGHQGLGQRRRQPGQDVGAGERAERARQAELGDNLPVDVAEPRVGEARRQGRADLGEVDGGRGRRRRGAEEEQQGGRGDAVGHAQAAVDQLGAEADEGDQDEGLHGADSGYGRRGQGAARASGGGGAAPGTARRVSSPDRQRCRRAAGRRVVCSRGAAPSSVSRRYVYQTDRVRRT